MKTSGVIICCLLAALTLSCESAHQRLNSINDLKNIDFGQAVPRHSLLLLYWFANIVHIDHYDTVTISFDPNSDFGSHHYGNYERMLDRPPWGYQFYTVGNLYADGAGQLPNYIRNPSDRANDGRNRDRIIFSAERQNAGAQRINQVYLTQHDPHSNDYDSFHTYQISTNLLQRIRQFGNPTALWRNINSPYYALQSSSTSNDGLGEICKCVCLAMLLVILMLVAGFVIIRFAPKH